MNEKTLSPMRIIGLMFSFEADGIYQEHAAALDLLLLFAMAFKPPLGEA